MLNMDSGENQHSSTQVFIYYSNNKYSVFLIFNMTSWFFTP
jgi:hypothetical protein